MKGARGKSTPAGAQEKLKMVSYDAFLDQLGKKDRESVERQVESYEQGGKPEQAKLWRRLVCLLATLAPHMPQVSGRKAVRFFIADGKHRLQMFALEDPGEGLAVYVNDVLAEAQKQGIVKEAGTKEDDDTPLYRIPGSAGQVLDVEVLSAQGTVNAPEYYRHMLGWNRRAIRIKLGPDATAEQVAAAEKLCQLAARPPKA